MQTHIFTAKQIKKAAALIQQGELVAFPTETVYGLGVNACDGEAAKKIFIAKGRPSDNPLIVHIADKKDLVKIAYIPPSKKNLIETLIKKFWPGPLTIILRKKSSIPLVVSGGLNTVAIRMPDHPIAQTLIASAGVPIAAPSANLSGKPSGTCFEHVFDDFNGKIAGIIKSKKCAIGLESTVVDLTTKKPVLLRPGGLSIELLKKVLPDLQVHAHNTSSKVKSPGMKYAHYAPDAKIILFEQSAHQKISTYATRFKQEKKKVKILRTGTIKNISKNVFSIFRQCDKDGIDYILISSVPEKGIGVALMNRIRKAAYQIVQ